MIRLGFISLFAVAFPLGPLCAFLNNILEIRIDAFKVVTQFKRPLPKKAQDIGIWLPILDVISKLSILTNVGHLVFAPLDRKLYLKKKYYFYIRQGLIIAFTSEFIPRQVYRYLNYSGNKLGIGSLKGYVNFTLSIRNVTHKNETLTC